MPTTITMNEWDEMCAKARIQFAAHAIGDGENIEDASNIADGMLEQFEKRFMSNEIFDEIKKSEGG